jgi:hypothetical protein
MHIFSGFSSAPPVIWRSVMWHSLDDPSSRFFFS